MRAGIQSQSSVNRKSQAVGSNVLVSGSKSPRIEQFAVGAIGAIMKSALISPPQNASVSKTENTMMNRVTSKLFECFLDIPSG